MFNKIACLLGVHRWGWAYTVDGCCNQQLLCKRCGRINYRRSRIEHRWDDNWGYTADGCCNQQLVCKRCSQVNRFNRSRIEHSWGEWQYVAPNSCQEVRICRRCREKEQQGRHHFVEDNYGMKCKQCGMPRAKWPDRCEQCHKVPPIPGGRLCYSCSLGS